MSKIGHTFHSSEFGQLNINCHDCGAVGYEIDCSLTYLGDIMLFGLKYRRFWVSNLKLWICDCPVTEVALTDAKQPGLTIPLVSAQCENPMCVALPPQTHIPLYPAPPLCFDDNKGFYLLPHLNY